MRIAQLARTRGAGRATSGTRLGGLAAVALAALSCASSEPESSPGGESAGCGAIPPASPGQTVTRTLPHGGLQRSFRLHVPVGYDSAEPAPLVLSFHGYTSTALFNEVSTTGLSDHADQHVYIVVYPQSTAFTAPGSAQVTSWNDLSCNASPGPAGPTCSENADPYPCPPECGVCGDCNWCSCHDDLGFVEALLDELEDKLCIDRDRLYALGFSNGGMFAQRLGCALPERLAAVAPLHGFLARGLGCEPAASPVAVLLLGGRTDAIVPFDGSQSSDGYSYTPMDEVAGAFASAQGCDVSMARFPTSADGHDGLACVEHPNCKTGAEVVRCEWNGGHAYPSAWGNDLVWEFFERHASKARIAE